MRRRPNICDACNRIKKRSDPAGGSIPYCDAFPDRVPDEIYFGGFDHRWAFEGDHGIQFDARGGKTPKEFDERAKGALRYAKLFDSLGPGNKPIVNRPPVPPAEVDRLVEALKSAPVVMSARGYSEDLVDPSQPKLVPLNYRTDGTWVWSGATAYHLEKHGIPPEADLVAHMRSRNWKIPEVHDSVQAAATSVVIEGPIMGPPPGRMPEPYRPSRRAPEVPAAPAAPAFLAAPVPLAPARRPEPVREPGRVFEQPRRSGLADGERAAREAVILERAERRLGEVGIPKQLYRLNGTADRGWSLTRKGDGWSVFWSENGARRRECAFDSLEDAAVFLIGRIIY